MKNTFTTFTRDINKTIELQEFQTIFGIYVNFDNDKWISVFKEIDKNQDGRVRFSIIL